MSLIHDSRKLPQIATLVIVKSAFAMFLSRLGSLNALEQLQTKSSALRKFLGAPLPSADTIGRVFSLIDTSTIRQANHAIYTQMKRNKSLEVPYHGLIAVNFDGHETHTSYLQHCSGCLERTINRDTACEKIQYYHRQVTAQLVFKNFPVLLDIESQLPGEDEVTCAIRLFKRIVADYPRAFDVVVADALYAKSNFFNAIIEHGKDVIAVLKDDRRDLLKDAENLFAHIPPTATFVNGKGAQIECWDAVDFQSWPRVNKPVRVVKTKETKKLVRRQLTGQLEQPPITSWTWVTTISQHRARTQAIVDIGHSRWNIENQGFNESVNRYFTDHIYKHNPSAMLNFWLLCLMAYNIFHCFYHRNLKPTVQARYTMLHIAREILAELYGNTPGPAHPT